MSKITSLTEYVKRIVNTVNNTLLDITGDRQYSYDIDQIQYETSTFCEELGEAIDELQEQKHEVENLIRFLNRLQGKIELKISDLHETLGLASDLDSRLQEISYDADIDCYPDEIDIDEVYDMMIENGVTTLKDLEENEDDDELPLEEEE